jgi:RNA-binding motif X-linked protein 2
LQRNANTGWGGGGAGRGDGGASWKHDQFDGSMKEATRRLSMSSTKRNDNGIGERDEKPRGVCYAFQRGECNRGDGCKFAHDEQVCFPT